MIVEKVSESVMEQLNNIAQVASYISSITSRHATQKALKHHIAIYTVNRKIFMYRKSQNFRAQFILWDKFL